MMIWKRAVVLAVLLLAIPLGARALGLGDVEVRSSLNQALKANIPLTGLQAQDLDGMNISLGTSEQFVRAGLDRPFFLSLLRFEVAEGPNGSAFIEVTTKEPISEPFLNFLIEVDWTRGRIVREYTVLLDPPLYSAEVSPTVQQANISQFPEPEVAQTEKVNRAPIASRPTPASTLDEAPVTFPQPVAAPETSNTFAPSEPTFAEPAFEPTPNAITGPQPASQSTTKAGVAPDTYGPVAPNDTLWSLASQLRPDASISVQQMMVALLRANPEAFWQDNINSLKAGAVMRIPAREEIVGLGQGDALSQAKQHNALWEEYRQASASAVTTAPEGEPTVSAAIENETTEPTETLGTVTEERKELSLVSNGDATSTDQAATATTQDARNISSLRTELALAQEEADRTQRENEELSFRLSEVEQLVQDLQLFVELKNDEIAALQRQLAEQDLSQAALDSELSVDPESLAIDPEEMTADEILAAELAGEELPENETAPEIDSVTTANATELAGGALSSGNSDASGTPAANEEVPPFAEEPSTRGTFVDNGFVSDEVRELRGREYFETRATLAAAEPVVGQPASEAVIPGPKVTSATNSNTGKSVSTEPAGLGFLDFLRQVLPIDPLLVGLGLVGLLAVGAGVVMGRRRRAAQAAAEDEMAFLSESEEQPMEASDTESPLDDAVNANEQAEVESVADVEMTDDELEPEDDPLAEVNVYIAYERYDQAEELVRTAINAFPDRHEYRLKLLEIYHAARNVTAFEPCFNGLRNLVGEDSPLMEQAMTWWQDFEGERADNQVADSDSVVDFDLGLDHNASTDVSDLSSHDVMAAAQEDHESSAQNLREESNLEEFNIADAEDIVKTGLADDSNEPELSGPTSDLSDEGTFVGLNPGVSEPTPLPVEESEDEKTISFIPEHEASDESDGDGFVLENDETLATDGIDLDLGSLGSATSDAHAGNSVSDSLDFELELGDEAMDLSLDPSGIERAVEADPEHLGAAAASSEDDTLGLGGDLLGTEVESGDDTPQDDSFSLEFSDEDRDEQTVRLGSSPDDLDLAFETDELEETQTKLELAEAFVGEGDHDGARRLIDEVVAEGDESQQHSAKELLEKLA